MIARLASDHELSPEELASQPDFILALDSIEQRIEPLAEAAVELHREAYQTIVDQGLYHVWRVGDPPPVQVQVGPREGATYYEETAFLYEWYKFEAVMSTDDFPALSDCLDEVLRIKDEMPGSISRKGQR